ncbi:MAG TPA: DMT family transporter [Bryobacteraceae bacterium]|jgi:drug/metabolite transporter (DMT)-like permease
MERQAWFDWALLALPGLIWGASFLFIAQGLEAVAPDGVTFLRFVIGFAALSLVPGARRPVLASDRVGIGWLGVLWMAFPMSMFPHAEQSVSSALTGMLNGAIPLIAASVAALLAKKVPARKVVYGLAVGFAGAVLMAVPGLDRGGSSARGVLMISVALISYGVAINLARPLQQRNGALPVVWRAMGVALVLTAPLGAPALWTARWSMKSAAAILALGLLGTAAANVIMAVAAGRLGATRASATTFLIPVVALLLGVTVRGERVAVAAMAGVAFCLAGAWLVRKGSLQHSERTGSL